MELLMIPAYIILQSYIQKFIKTYLKKFKKTNEVLQVLEIENIKYSNIHKEMNIKDK